MEDVLNSTEYIQPAIELIDSRIKNWNIKLVDTIADNASSAGVILGGEKTNPRLYSPRLIGANLTKNGELIAHGAMGGVIYIGSSSGDDVNVGVGATIHASSGNAVFAGIVTATTLKYGTTSVETAIDAKASTGKAIAMAMVFGF